MLPLQSACGKFLSLSAAENLHDLGNLLTLVLLVATRNRMLDAVRHMIAEDLLFSPSKGRPNGGYLRHHVDAVAVFLNHPGHASDLAFDAGEPFQHGWFAVFLHA
jgi:hypothetical protein